MPTKIERAEIERAEQALMVVAAAGSSPGIQFRTCHVSHEDFANVLAHHRDAIKERNPNMDPRLDSTFNTMMMHFFLIGVLAGRNAERDTR